MAIEIKKAIRVNHGNAFGNGNTYYTFYCPYCRRQQPEIAMDNRCFDCFELIDWNGLEDDK